MMKPIPGKILQIQLFIFLSFLSLSINSAYAQKQAVKRTGSGVWYLEHLPENYNSGDTKFPVIIFLHGLKERGDGSATISKIKKWGPPKHIENGHDMTFRVNGKSHSFVVISPQLPTDQREWPPSMVDGIINDVLENYKVDPDRVYLTGLSLGGGGAWAYAVSSYNKPNKLAAIAPVCGFLSSAKSKKDTKHMADTDIAVWGFHNSQDNTVPISHGKQPIDGLKRHKPKTMPKFTVYNVKGHNAWTKAYTTNNSVHSPNLYQWLLTNKRGGSVPPAVKNQTPIAKAGSDQTIQLPRNHVILNGSGSKDKDGKIRKYYWKKISGPSATIKKSYKASTSAKDLKEGRYIFELAVTDNKGATAKDRITVTVKAKDTPKHSEPVADKGVSGKNGLNYKYYEGGINKVSEISRQRVKKQGVIANFDISPMQRTYHIGFEFTGYIDIKRTGTYTFYTASDDGSVLWIDEQKIVNNDGRHGKRERSGKVYLKAGMHAVKLAFFEHTGGQVLEVKYAGPGISKRKIPDNVLYQNGNDAAVAGTSSYAASEENGLTYKYYEGSVRAVAAVSRQKMKKQGKVANFTLAPMQRTYEIGFEFGGYIKIEQSGNYTFYTASDDGSALWIGSDKVVDNDGRHGRRERSGSIYLKAGMHPIKVVYFEYLGKEILEVGYAGPGISKRKIPDNVLYQSNSSNARIAVGSSKKYVAAEEVKVAEVDEPDERLRHIEVTAYPNPVADILNVHMSGDAGEVATISVIDQLGRVIYAREEAMDGYAQKVELDAAVLGLESGMVFLQIEAPSFGRKTFRLLKK